MSSTPKIQLVCERVRKKVMSSLEEASVAHVGIIDDPEMATIASYQEYGWVQRVTARQAGWFRRQLGSGPKVGTALVLQPRPFFRGTIAAESKNWAGTYRQALKVYGPDNAYKALLVTAIKASEDIKATMINGGTSDGKFHDRKPLTQALYSAQAGGREKDGTGNIEGPKPLIKSGALLNSIGYQLG